MKSLLAWLTLVGSGLFAFFAYFMRVKESAKTEGKIEAQKEIETEIKKQDVENEETKKKIYRNVNEATIDDLIAAQNERHSRNQ